MSGSDAASNPLITTPAGKPRARALGLSFDGEPGPFNAITDVPGLEVGYETIIRGEDVRTGATAIHPRGSASSGDPVAAGFHSQNGNGEMTGVPWIEESGTFSGPVVITNTHSVGTAHAAVVSWTLARHPELGAGWLLPVVAETWDGFLNDINGRHVDEQAVIAALDAASNGPIEQGSVGGGTGMSCYQFKGGSGSSSRIVEHHDDRYRVGVFLQTNFGRRRELTIGGMRVGETFADDPPVRGTVTPPPGAGSVIGFVATDAPLLAYQCKALARRVTLGLARTGTSGSHFSGDIFLACSTGNRGAITPGLASRRPGARPYDTLSFIPWGDMDPFFTAVVQATEEAVVDSLIANEDMVGKEGHRVPALPRQRLVAVLAEGPRGATQTNPTQNPH
ncbi:MAG: P1 family peptidase [Acidimicrobiales bacterium]